MVLQTVQGGKWSFGRDVMLLTLQVGKGFGRDVTLQTVQGESGRGRDVMLQTVQGGKCRWGET